MNRYFFDFYNGSSVAKDNVGEEFKDPQNLALEARQALIEVFSGIVAHESNADLSFHVLNSSGELVYKVSITLQSEFHESNFKTDQAECKIVTRFSTINNG